ncbi:MAG: DUF4886 domain-containing protein [Bacteroidaceae bacterium]|nr:DUF4886 domain-containing protein [Bacteroidaceae bacterium]
MEFKNKIRRWLAPMMLALTNFQNVNAQDVGYLCNPPLPYMPVKLDILFIGNSFSIDTSSALPSILESLGVSTVNVYVMYKGGCSMKQHWEHFMGNKKAYELYHYNYLGERKLSNSISLNEVFSTYAFDIVVFQQYSLESGNYDTYEPYLSKLIQAYKLTTLSPRTTFAFNQTWAYSSKNKNLSRYKNQEGMYNSIVAACKKMKARSGIDVIIPCGTAVQNARNIEALKTEGELTRDDLHIDLNMGRYLLGCTFYEAIIAPCLGRNIHNDISIIGKSGAPNQVNNSNRRLLQDCAKLAVANNWSVSEMPEPEK